MENSAIEVPLTRGKFAIVDLQDLPRVKSLKWQVRSSKGNWYAIHSTTDGEIPMHVFLLGKVEGMEVDHVNQNGLDNRRSNLRHSTKSQNRINVAVKKNNTSGFKGVSFSKPMKKWVAYIQKDYKRKHLGFFDTREEAAKVYNSAAAELFGEYAWQNPIH